MPTELTTARKRSGRCVRIVYESEFARLKSRAKVKDYLALLTSRRTREKLLGKPSE